MNSWKLLFLLVFLHIGSFLQGQNKEEKLPLAQVLTILESRYRCQFNYVVETTEGILLEAPPKLMPLKKVIKYLGKETGLNYRIVSQGFITIEPRKTFVFCGHLKDELTKEPIISATIQSDDSAVISDSLGYFKIKTIDRKLTIRHLGYKTTIIETDFFNSDGCSTIYLDQQDERLSEVVIMNLLTKGINKKSDGSYLIDFSNFGILPGLLETDALQTVQALPGVQSINETVSNINIRGGSNDQNLLLWDGIKMYQSGHFFGLISIYNPFMTPYTRLIKNGSQVDYTDGVSGTIEMGTAQDLNDEFTGSLGLNFISAYGFADIPLGRRSSLQVAARNSISNLVKTPTYNSYADRIISGTDLQSNLQYQKGADIEFDFYDASLRWLWEINDINRLRISFMNVRNEFDFKEDFVSDATQNFRSSTLFQNSLSLGLHYKRNWSNSFTSELQAYVTDYGLEAKNQDRIKDQLFMQENHVLETGLKFNGFYTMKNGLKLLTGYQFTQTQITDFDFVDDPIYRLKVREIISTHGLYGQLHLESQNNSAQINIGFRFNYIDKLDTYRLEPRVSYNQKLFKHFTFEILGEMKHQVTSQVINFQSDFLGIEKRRWQLANNSDIPLIKSRQASAGLHYVKKGWLVSGETYIKDVTGITAQSQGFQNQYEFVKSIGSYNAYGIDFLIRKEWEKFNTWLSYSNMENHYRFAFSERSFPNNLEIYNAITFGSSFKWNKLKLSAGFTWHSGKPTTLPIIGEEIVNGQVNYEPANSSVLDEYFRTDLSAHYQMNLSEHVKADLSFSIWNISGHRNNINKYYYINDSGTLQEVNKYGLNTTPNFSFRLSF